MHAHPRHRSPGNGYNRSSTATATAPAGAFHGPADYPNFNRGGRPNSFPPPRKADIFVEAGRLAAEYLVSQGLLPPTVLSSNSNSKWPNGYGSGSGSGSGSFSLKRLLRQPPQEPEHLQLGQEARTSALARLGDAGGSSRRRFVEEEHSPSGFRNPPRGGRRRFARASASDWGRDYSRSGGAASFHDHNRLSDADADDDTVSDHQGSKDVVVVVVDTLQHKSLTNDVSSKTPPDSGTPDLDDMDSRAKPSSSSSSSAAAFAFSSDSSQTTQEPEKTTSDDGSRNLNAGIGAAKLKDIASVDETVKQQNVIIKESEGDSSNNTTDLLTSLTMWCKFAKVPTRIRSSLTSRSTKADPAPAAEVEQASATSPLRKMEVSVAEDSLAGSSSDALLHRTHDFKRFNSEILRAPSVENVGGSGPLYDLQHGKCERSLSLPNRAFACDNERELSQGALEYSSSDKEKERERGEKRALEDGDMREGAKRPRDWPLSVVMEASGCFNISNLSQKNVSSREEEEEGASSGDRVIMDVDHDNSVVRNSQFSKDGDKPRVDLSQEKQLFPSSFKICDLNLMEVSETHENHDGDPIIIYPTLSEMKREAVPVDIDLSISNSNVSGENSKRPVDSKEIEVIDLENDSAQEDKDLVIEDRKTETVYTDLEGFPNHAQTTGDIPDVQDGLGLMISELLGNEFPNCSSVPEHINPMHNDIGLHNGEGALADDDSIYMSLGEIPLTFLRPWEQPPPQEYEKPF
ncbi:hypothetical protein TorRG33x02_009660 [Trema orientale]|uniref:Uncharacterized protein n=1 Tax=Trema orientale TaxID=63057 RepID=A0A2P5FYN6_TREOI|nr:hypothetical protein TorRG33x02_009660 [Trema orientale]